ncbi:serine/threonine-protein kinase OXI1-like protein [Cinnamomum micranthum f. kanehirae]|uniref:non-specific serine/threonine protein kinase n=1 Tax=Cinnamomum micranthum f. kanehirae TaxID=337451 RepID=A0A3S3QFR6_9MAGN|nr:serine/threonine-protein kinase OXI1-like protein [Cinnamomum micranthum f. kanehirae]
MDDHHTTNQYPPLDLRSLKALSVLGRGAKGVAFLVRHGDQTLALKTISKSSIEKNKKPEDGLRRIRFELDTLKELQHPLLPTLRGFLSTEKIVGFAMEYCSGGDLNSLRKKQTEKSFSDDIIRFYAAELVLALEYLHGLGIVYRDLKPENVLIQENGHLMLVDFDLSKKLSLKKPLQNQQIPSNRADKSATKSRFPAFLLCKSGFPAKNSVNSERSDGSESSSLNSGESGSESKSNSFVGTQDYVAPEVITGNGHDFSVDWWNLGVLLYEMLYGQTPFRGSNRKETFYRILTKSPEMVGEQTPLRDLIGKLLEKEPEKRISVEGIKGHEFFQGVVWETVVEISRPPFIPGGRGEEISGLERDVGIDVEDFVERVFCDSGVEVGKERDLEKKDEKKGVWVDALRDSRRNLTDLLVF